MHPAFVVRFHPSGPWRIGPDSGARDTAECILHSDALYSAVTGAIASLGLLEDWLGDVFASQEAPAVCFSSAFPFQDEHCFVLPPRNLWPPAPSLRTRWKGARLVPLELVQDMLSGRPLGDDKWKVDGASRCLVPSHWTAGPFEFATRSQAAVDRMLSATEAYQATCMEFRPGAGMWAAACFKDDSAQSRWEGPVKSAFKLLADSGLGGKRSCGWGCSNGITIQDGVLPDLLLKPAPPAERAEDEEPKPVPETAYWLLSVFSPAGKDMVDWGRGDYSMVTRGGRVVSAAAHGEEKKLSRMVTEGSVLFSADPPSGAALNVAPDGVPHPVYRAGFAFSLPVAWKETVR
jgi:CRISPR type III-A-associated RAMP protein Csm4